MKRDYSYGVIPIKKTNDGIKILLIQHQEGHWACPKGHPEPGETNLQTAAREFEEETGIVEYSLLEEPKFFEEYQVKQDSQLVPKIVTYHIAVVRSDEVEVQPEEVRDYGWFSYDDALKKVTFENTKKMLISAEKFLR